MSFANEPIFQWLAQYAYQPNFVYLAVLGMMLASGFGLPLPEEVTIVSVGILTYMGANPEIFPPPYQGAPVVEGYEAAAVTLFAVIFADYLVFTLGRIFGRKLLSKPKMKQVFSENALEKINQWVQKFGIYAAFIFRFTPGIRFPAHIILGMSKFPGWQFALVDGFAALISVPTQILLIYHFGEPILKTIHKFKIWFFGAVAVLIVVYILRKLWHKYRPPVHR
ncbi:MAG: alpha-amylase [Oligoflexia bacterium]|nr:MAG: alpha-amylase [Oligoflexia bacterium]